VWEVTKLNVTICVNACARENSRRGIMGFLARLGNNFIKGGFRMYSICTQCKDTIRLTELLFSGLSYNIGRNPGIPNP